MQNKDKNQEKNLNTNQQDLDKEVNPGSNISDPEEKEARKNDDWRSHRHEKNRDPNAEFRSAELHGVVGKEIEQVIEHDKPKVFKNQNLDYGNDIVKENTPMDKNKPKDFNNKSLDVNPQETKLGNQMTEKFLEKIEHQGVPHTEHHHSEKSKQESKEEHQHKGGCCGEKNKNK
jgi:hypothetical protein